MTNLLLKFFVKDYENIQDAKVREKYGTLSSFVGIFCNVLLFFAKYMLGLLSHSIAITSDAFNNLSDSVNCMITLFGYKMAAKPADKDHPFGHGRIEYLTSLSMAVIILLMGFELFKGSVEKMMNPEKVTFSYFVLGGLLLSIVVKIWMAFFNKKLGKRINSGIMLATAKDSLNDVIATSTTVIALVASIFTTFPIDGIMGTFVSVFILYSGFQIIKDTVDELLGKPAEKEFVEELEAFVLEKEEILGMHDLMIHNYGPGKQIGSMHVEIDSKGNIIEIHDRIDQLEKELYEKYQLIMTVHMDPIDNNNEYVKTYREKVDEILKSIDENLSMHDFRVVRGTTHTNLIFDVVVPFEYQLKDNEIKEKIDVALEAENTIFYTVITFDRKYS